MDLAYLNRMHASMDLTYLCRTHASKALPHLCRIVASMDFTCFAQIHASTGPEILCVETMPAWILHIFVESLPASICILLPTSTDLACFCRMHASMHLEYVYPIYANMDFASPHHPHPSSASFLVAPTVPTTVVPVCILPLPPPPWHNLRLQIALHRTT